MADLKISQLSASSALAGTEVTPIVQGAATKKATIDQILSPAAGKGVNFVANTPAEGMTSQLLNWYEEGTWTPTVTSLTGAITSYTSSGTYTRIGRQVTVNFDFTVTNNGTGATAIGLSNLPFATTGAYSAAGTALEAAIVGFQCTAYMGGSNAIYIFKYDWTYPAGANYRIVGTITYPV